MPNQEAPFYPIIYIRGYAMSQNEQNESSADPFCGFNLGSTVYRAAVEKSAPPKKFIFESPVLRLVTDYGYSDSYLHGVDIMDPDWEGTIPSRSIVIYRYYDSASSLLGTGKTPDIAEFARGLSRLILRVRDLVVHHPESGITEDSFRCYLIAHSMGGLICRAFLQNPALGEPSSRRSVDKVFTYATPHNGIDMAGVNVPGWLTLADMKNFNRDYMSEYLNLQKVYKEKKRVDWLPEGAFPSDRFFCMIGTNRVDYGVAMGLSSTFAGHGSDGLVKIENASVWGLGDNGNLSAPTATAYAYRSHSGFFGIVNSEEAFQNLSRFLFGDVRVDIWVDVEGVDLPVELQGKAVNALYLFEVLASPRGKRWYLTRRVAEEDSVACQTHLELAKATQPSPKSIYLSTIFLANRARVNPDSPSLAYAMTLGVRVPDYEVDRKFWADKHYEGGYLFRDTVLVELVPPQVGSESWTITFDWQSHNIGRITQPLAYETLKNGKLQMRIPFGKKSAPGIIGQVRFVVSAWN